ncbi:MAG: hypothetical protein IMW90_13950 [Thermogemmatispora sp.]|jgi:hypothetical protein|uniref:Uncharacterized protein n=1 Tax=Thermogemmatispora aurantia TaxID=2045279 RepID=A0A5J4K5T4_9CHLR|nr:MULTISPECIES: hypothetical protein [Thermogemmatispora]MBE3566822.1 hypothetical protein [Thermogemmatispora sp.]GER82091.1 hypothetical protein KTAU_07290 [Thermogemmatispora aurantia]
MHEDTLGHDQPPQSHGPHGSVRRIYRPPATRQTMTVACSTCGAIFAPSHLHSELHLASPSVLEAALMSMSHFCFRCRRASCPECWDHVHRLCGACVAELGLPFRHEVPPLEGTLFPPAAPALSTTPSSSDPYTCQADNSGPTPDPLLTCVQAGRFRTPSSPSTFIAAIETVEMQGVLPPTSPGPITSEAYPSPSAAAPSSSPATPESTTASSTHDLPAREQAPLRPPLASSAATALPSQQATPSHNLPSSPLLTSQATSKAAYHQADPIATPKALPHATRSVFPLWLSLPLLALLTLALTAVFLSELSSAFDALLLRAIHIDIRGTINLFLQWIQWFH